MFLSATFAEARTTKRTPFQNRTMRSSHSILAMIWLAVVTTASAIDIDHFSNLEAAPEVLQVEITEAKPDGDKGEHFAPMEYTAKVVRVDRTNSGVRVGDTIKIKHSYIHSGASFTGAHLTAPLGKGKTFVRLKGGKGIYHPVSGASGFGGEGIAPAPETLKVKIATVTKGKPLPDQGDTDPFAKFLAPVAYTAKVLQVDRTKSGIKVGDTIKIQHTYLHEGRQLLGTNYRTAPLEKGEVTFVRLNAGAKGIYRPVNEIDVFYKPGIDTEKEKPSK